MFPIGSIQEFQKTLKLFYLDYDGDVISVTGQDDLDECNMLVTKKFALCSTVQEARELLSLGQSEASGLLNKSNVQSLYPD